MESIVSPEYPIISQGEAHMFRLVGYLTPEVRHDHIVSDAVQAPPASFCQIHSFRS